MMEVSTRTREPPQLAVNTLLIVMCCKVRMLDGHSWAI